VADPATAFFMLLAFLDLLGRGKNGKNGKGAADAASAAAAAAATPPAGTPYGAPAPAGKPPLTPPTGYGQAATPEAQAPGWTGPIAHQPIPEPAVPGATPAAAPQTTVVPASLPPFPGPGWIACATTPDIVARAQYWNPQLWSFATRTIIKPSVTEQYGGRWVTFKAAWHPGDQGAQTYMATEAYCLASAQVAPVTPAAGTPAPGTYVTPEGQLSPQGAFHPPGSVPVTPGAAPAGQVVYHPAASPQAAAADAGDALMAQADDTHRQGQAMSAADILSSAAANVPGVDLSNMSDLAQ
jgi:hypothetical protein